MFTEKMQREFIEFYKNLYGDTSKETGTGELPHIKAQEEEKHREMRKEELTKII